MTKLRCAKCDKEIIYGYDDEEDVYNIYSCECINEEMDSLRKSVELINELVGKCYCNDNILESDINYIKKRLSIVDNLEESINKIIPEYKNVPMEYKSLLFKERVNNTYITSSKYFFNENQINELATCLKDKKSIVFIKNIRQFLDIPLKDAKKVFDDTFSNQNEFNKDRTFEEAKKLIIERI